MQKRRGCKRIALLRLSIDTHRHFVWPKRKKTGKGRLKKRGTGKEREPPIEIYINVKWRTIEVLGVGGEPFPQLLQSPQTITKMLTSRS